MGLHHAIGGGRGGELEPRSKSSASRPSALTVQSRVIGALVLRDVKTRFFGNGLGYIFAILWPLTHIVMLLVLYKLLDRVAPLGSSMLLFFAISLAPVISVIYMSRWIMISIVANKPLLNFPIVKFVDILVARSILEVACSFCVVIVLGFILFVADELVAPQDVIGASAAFLAALLLGLGYGAVNAVIAVVFPGWVLISILIRIVLYVTSGVLFLPSAFPSAIQDVLYWNPLLHSVEWMREAYYLGYVSPVLDKHYILGVGAFMLFATLWIEWAFRQFLTRAP